jgi:hypothetical protein
MMAVAAAGPAIRVDPRRGEYPLPWPVPTGTGEFPVESVWQGDPACASLQIVLPLPSGAVESGLERHSGDAGQHRDAIPVGFGVADEDLTAPEIEVFDSQGESLEKAQARTVEK